MANSSSTSMAWGPIPTGTVSAHIGKPPNTTDDYYIAKYLLMAMGKITDPTLGAFMPPARPAQYVYETRGPRIITSMSIDIAVMVIVTGLRLGVRVFRRRLLVGWDDFFIIPGVLLAIAWPTLQICAVIYGGAGKHMYDVTYEEYGHFKTAANLSKPMFFLAVGFIKVSICLFNRRLTSLTSRTWSIFNNLFLVLLFCYIMLSLFWTLFQCDPPYAGWDPIRVGREGKSIHCIGNNIVGSILSVIHVIMDFALLSVPLIVLWKVRMGWGNFVALQNWTLIDLCFGVVAASLPIFSAFIPKSWKSTPGTTGPNSARAKNSEPQNWGGTHVRSTRRTSISGKREASDSTENIVRTDVIELSFQNKSQFFEKTSTHDGTDGQSLGSEGIYPFTERKIWIGHDQAQ